MLGAGLAPLRGHVGERPVVQLAAWKAGTLCLHCAEKEAELLAVRFTNEDESELMKATVVVPSIGDLR